MTWLDRVDPDGVDHLIPMTSRFLPPNASGLGPRPSIESGCPTGKAGSRGRGKEEDICNTNRFLSLSLTIGLQEHQEQHVCRDK